MPYRHQYPRKLGGHFVQSGLRNVIYLTRYFNFNVLWHAIRQHRDVEVLVLARKNLLAKGNAKP